MVRTLLLALVGLLLVAGVARAGTRVSAGIFGGSSVPVAQDVEVSSLNWSDAVGPSGSQFGLRADVKAFPVVTLEPFYMSTSYDDDEETFNGLSYTRDGWDVTAWGLNAVFGTPDGPGFHFFPYVGLGSFSMERTGDEIDEIGWNFGLGFGYEVARNFSLQLRPEVNMVVTGETSRKFGTVSLGLNYVIMP